MLEQLNGIAYYESLQKHEWLLKDSYMNVQHDENIWFVVKKDSQQPTYSAAQEKVPTFERLRTIRFINGTFTCNCNYKIRTGNTCSHVIHVMCVLNKNKHIN